MKGVTFALKPIMNWLNDFHETLEDLFRTRSII